MTKRKTKEKNQTNLILIALVTGLLSIFIVVFCVQKYQQRRLEDSFKKIDSSITNLRENLKYGVGDKLSTKDSYCFSQQYKWEKRTIRCEVTLKIEGVSMESVILIKNNIRNSAEWVEQRSPGLEHFPYDDGIYINKETGMNCSFVVSQSTGLFDVSFSCSENSKRAFYPYANK